MAVTVQFIITVDRYFHIHNPDGIWGFKELFLSELASEIHFLAILKAI